MRSPFDLPIFFLIFISTTKSELLGGTYCLSNSDCNSPKESVCNTTIRNCEPCVTASDCTRIFNYPVFVTCSAASRVCENCLGGCGDLGATMTLYQSGYNPRVIKLYFDKPLNKTGDQMKSVIQLTLPYSSPVDYDFRVNKLTDSIYEIKFTPFKSLGYQIINITFLIPAKIQTYLFELNPVFSDDDYKSYLPYSVITGIIMVTGIIFCFIVPSIDQRNQALSVAFIGSSQTFFSILCFNVPIPISLMMPLKWLSFPRIGWLPNLFTIITDILDENLKSKFNFEAAMIDVNIFISIGGILSCYIIVILILLGLRIVDKLMKRIEWTRTIDKCHDFFYRRNFQIFFHLFYNDMVLGAFVAIQTTNSDDFLAILSVNASYTILLCFIPIIIISAIMIWRDKSNRKDPLGEYNYMAKYGEYASLICSFRRYFLPFIIIIGFNNPVLAFVGCLSLNGLYIAYIIKTKPFLDLRAYKMHLVSEFNFVIAIIIQLPASYGNKHDINLINRLGIASSIFCLIGLTFSFKGLLHIILKFLLDKLKERIDPKLIIIKKQIRKIMEKYRDKSLDRLFIPDEKVVKLEKCASNIDETFADLASESTDDTLNGKPINLPRFRSNRVANALNSNSDLLFNSFTYQDDNCIALEISACQDKISKNDFIFKNSEETFSNEKKFSTIEKKESQSKFESTIEILKQLDEIEEENESYENEILKDSPKIIEPKDHIYHLNSIDPIYPIHSSTNDRPKKSKDKNIGVRLKLFVTPDDADESQIEQDTESEISEKNDLPQSKLQIRTCESPVKIFPSRDFDLTPSPGSPSKDKAFFFNQEKFSLNIIDLEPIEEILSPSKLRSSKSNKTIRSPSKTPKNASRDVSPKMRMKIIPSQSNSPLKIGNISKSPRNKLNKGLY